MTTIKTNCDVLKAKLMEHFDGMDSAELIGLWNEHNDDDRIEDIDEGLPIYFEGACKSDPVEFLNRVYYGSIDNWPNAAYFTINAYGNLFFLQDISDADSPFDAEILAGQLIDDGAALVDEIRDGLIEDTGSDAEAWDDGGDASPAVYLEGLRAMDPADAGEASEMARAWQAWQDGQALGMADCIGFQGFFEDIADRYGLREEFEENAII